MGLAENVVHFARALRRAGVPVGPDRVMDGLRALESVGVENREDFYWALASVFLSRHEQFELFDQAFQLVWHEHTLFDRVAPGLPVPPSPDSAADKTSNRIADALGLTKKVPMLAGLLTDEPDILRCASDIERLKKRDFETMTAEEMEQGKRLIAGLRLPIPLIQVRRLHPDLVLLDVQLPDMDGFEIARRLQADRDPPAIVLTSSRDAGEYGSAVADSGATKRPLPADPRFSGGQTLSLCQPDAWRQARTAVLDDGAGMHPRHGHPTGRGSWR